MRATTASRTPRRPGPSWRGAGRHGRGRAAARISSARPEPSSRQRNWDVRSSQATSRGPWTRISTCCR
eukprot:7075676-Alexandrium_andersonii.AAC.1